MKKKLIIVLLLLMQLHKWSSAKETTPVLLMLSTEQQSQSFGYNYVQQFSHLMYTQLMSGKLKVWDSHDKKNRLSVDSIVAIQDASETFFSDLYSIFIYENWTKTKSEIQTTTLGFSFIAKNKLGENVSYGYIDYADVKTVLSTNIVTVNANGNYNQSFNTVLMIKAFDYAIIQFGSEVNQDRKASEKIKKEYLAEFPFNDTAYPVRPQRKLVQYVIEHQTDGKSSQVKFTNAFLTAVDSYFVANQSRFFSKELQLRDTVKRTDSTHLEVTELWELKSGVISQVQQLIITVNNQPLRPLSVGELMDMDFSFEQKDLLQVLNQKKFKYIITKINSQGIDSSRSNRYQKALLNMHWSDLNKHAK